MEARAAKTIPTGAGWQYEPKWDGFRCLVHRRGREVVLKSKAGRPLGRYFPELVQAIRELPARGFVLDGEITVTANGKNSFDHLLMRIHPAQSRVQKLSSESPAQLMVFDMLGDEDGRSLLDRPLRERRKLLEKFAKENLVGSVRVRLSPVTRSLSVVQRWFNNHNGNFDGVIAKRLDAGYRAGERSAMEKIKPIRTADCVVGGFRYAEKKHEVGSLLLGLYDAQGRLHHVGFCSGLKASERPALTGRLERLIKPPGFTGRAPGGPSRWSNKRTSEWKPLQPQLVAEVEFDHVTGQRFRHGTRFVRWRPDKKPTQCRMNQLSH
jgi:ATP-dependent DNA ligase